MFVEANIFQPLISVFQSVIMFFHNSVGLSWGWSIILLTVCVRLVLVPLTLRQFHSMRRLQAHQPEMKAIQQRYKDNKQRQQEEMMKFYRENNVNPLASCLPMVLQLPVFISLFYMLRENLRKDICPSIQRAYHEHLVAIHKFATLHAAAGQTTACGTGKGAGFLFINDITSNPTGVTLVVLLVLYVGTQAVSTQIMSGPTMDPAQRRMMMLLPLIFVVFVFNFPAGLIVYWITTNAWTMGQQLVLKQIFGPPPVPNAVMVEEQLKEGAEAAERGVMARLRSLVPSSQSADKSSGRQGARSRQEAAAPPPPPRKKKKRSGRRR